jgi:acyl-CoA thioester hydrolase
MSKLGVRVYYEDTDSGGVVYYANYLKYIERGRTEFLRELGFNQDQLIAQDNILFIVRSIEANYLSPAFLDDLIEVYTEIKSVSHASLTFAQKIVNIEKNTVLFNAEVKVVSVLKNNFKPCALPQVILEELNGRQ